MEMALRKCFVSVLVGLPIFVAAAASHAEDTLSAEEVKALVTDKTVHARHMKQNYNFTNFFAQDGAVRQVTEAGEKKTGTWRVESDGALCVSWAGEVDPTCGAVIDIGGGKYKRMRVNPRNIMAGSIHVVTFERIESGNPQGL
jgi:hypothetical protein